MANLTRPDVPILGSEIQEWVRATKDSQEQLIQTDRRLEALEAISFLGMQTFESTAVGLDNTIWGQYFAVLSDDPNVAIDVYLNNNGQSELIRSFSSFGLFSEYAALNLFWQNRPGEVKDRYTRSISGDTLAALPVLHNSKVTDRGKVLEILGGSIVATRSRIVVEENQSYYIRFVLKRTQDPLHVSGRPVNLKIAWLDKDKELIQTQTIKNWGYLKVLDGVQKETFYISNVNLSSNTINPLAGAVYFVPYIETFGEDQYGTDNQKLELEVFDFGRLNIVSNPVARTFYVTMNGDNTNIGSNLTSPFRTVNRALQAATELGLPCVIIVHPGEYVIQPETVIPPNCALYSYDLRVTKFSLPTGQEVNNMFLMTNGIKVRGVTFIGLQHEDPTDYVDIDTALADGLVDDDHFTVTTNNIAQLYRVEENNGVKTAVAVDYPYPPRKGFAFAFKPGEYITRSPYISECSQLHNFSLEQLTLPIDKEKGNPLMPRGGGNIIADGSVLDKDSPLRSVVVDSFTAINPNGIGYLIRKSGFVQLVSVFTNWSRVGVWSHRGGQVTVATSNSTFGDYGLAATSFRKAIKIDGLNPSLLSVQTASATAITTNLEAIVTNLMTVRYPQLTGWSNLTPAQIELTERDTRTLLRSIVNDLNSGQDRGAQYFVKGLFDWNANYVFNPALKQIFIDSWNVVDEALFTYVTDTTARTMITNLLGLIIDVVNNPTPYTTIFPSVVEASGQQFSYAGSGVNYNAIPFGQRGTGIAPNPVFALLKKEGGKIYSTFATEKGDTYLGEDLRVDFEKNTIEGQAFSRGVQNITLPLIVGFGG